MKNIFPNDPKYKKRFKTYRAKNVKNRNKWRKENYSKSRPKVRKHMPWTEEEIISILFWDCCNDVEIAAHWGRSVQAIQQKRYLLKKRCHD